MGNTNEPIKFQWYCQSNRDEEQLTAYPPDINQEIELAFLEKKSAIIIDKCHKIDLIKQVQINLTNADDQRRVVRRDLTRPRESRRSPRDNKRFQHSATAIRTFNLDTEFRGCDFIADWYKWITNGTLKLDKSELVDLTIDGILAEAKLYSDDEKVMDDAHRFVKELQQVRNARDIATIQEVCLKLYTEDSFLYRVINETLRDNNRSKFETLGPFCYLLYNYSGSSRNKQGKLPEKIVLYRGEPLTREAIEEYKAAVGKNVIWRWTQFVSTSKQRDVAEEFGDGKSLYVIEMRKRSASDQGVCIASLSAFTAEDEVLLRPGIRFKMIKIEEEETGERHVIHIDIIPSYMSGLD